MLSLDQQNARREQYRRQQPDWQPATEQFAAWVRDHLRPDSRVLDIGCGRGGLVEQLTHPLERVIGLDPDWSSVREHRLPLPRAVGWSNRLPFAAAQFDLAYASWVLEHLADPTADLRDIARVLRPGGVFVFVTPNATHPLIRLNRGLSRLERLQRRAITRLYGRAEADTFPAYYQANRFSDLHALANTAELTVKQLVAIPDPTYLAFNDVLFRMMVGAERFVSAENKLHLVGVLQKPI